MDDDDLALELEARDELLIEAREVLATIGNERAVRLVRQIEVLLDLENF